MTDHEHIFDLRVLVTRGIVIRVDDTGVVQIMDVQTHDGVLRGEVEVHQPFGLASSPPENGAVTVLFANGGDPSDMIALPASSPAARLGGLLRGETAIYGSDGTRVHIKRGGKIQVLAATEVDITAPTCKITASSGITLTGDVSITGSLSVGGSASIGGDLHVTGNITAGGTITGH